MESVSFFDILNTPEGRYMLAYCIAVFAPVALAIFGLGLVIGGSQKRNR